MEPTHVSAIVEWRLDHIDAVGWRRGSINALANRAIGSRILDIKHQDRPTV